MKKIGTIGGATQDVFIFYEGSETMNLHTTNSSSSFLLLEQGTKIDINNLTYACGGGATNSAVSFKRLGFDVEAFFAVGNDEAGSYITQKMLAEKIGIGHSLIKKDAQTDRSFIIPSCESNSVVLCSRGANKLLSCEDFSLEDLSQFSYLYISPLSGNSQALLSHLAAQSKKLDIPVAVNPGMSHIISDLGITPALENITILLQNAVEARCLTEKSLQKKLLDAMQPIKIGTKPALLTFFTPSTSLYDYFTEVFKRGPSIAVVTNGAEGVYVGTPEMLYFHPSIKTEPLCSLGAGDAFHSTFVGCLALGRSIEEALVFGVLNASSVTEFSDAQSGLLTYDILEKKAQKIGVNHLQKYPMNLLL